jgi:Ser/Thr protein kinase RdoA (MazF antagonist)
VTEAEVRRIATDCFGLIVTDVRALAGERDRNFRLRQADGPELSLKVVHPGEPAAVTDLQTEAMRHVALVDPWFPVPRVVPPLESHAGWCVWRSDAGVEHRVRCVTYLPGRPLADTPRSPEQRRALGATLARLDLALADLRHPADAHDLLWDVKRADRGLELLDAVGNSERYALPTRVLERFVRVSQPRLGEFRDQVIHNDYNLQNVLLDEADATVVTGVIDFGDAIRAPLVQDLGTTCAYHLQAHGHPFDAVAQLVGGFHAVCPLEAREIALLPDVMAGRLALSVAITSWRAPRHPDNAPYILRSSEIAWAGLAQLDAIGPDLAGRWLLERVTDA